MRSLNPQAGSISRRVLLVDDDPTVGKAISAQVRGLGYVVDTVGSAAKALAMAEAHEYEVVLSDLLMPDVDGLELMSRLAGISAVTSFVMMTGAGDPGAQGPAAANERITRVLLKPFGEGELEAALRQAFEVAEKRRALATPRVLSLRVLVVEDSPTDALLLQQCLRWIGGYDVVHVSSLGEAVKALHDGPFDVVITDLTLPDGRGLDAVVRIRQSAPETTLIVRSGMADDAVAMRALELGAQEFVAKDDLTVEALSRTIAFARVRREAERRLVRLAYCDPLTGLWNRAMFAEQLDQVLARAKRQASTVGVLYVDLDGFKAVNDRLGHAAGDQVLRQVATRLRRSLREYDVVARLGGDEFAILTTNLSLEAAEATASRIRNALGQPFEVAGQEASVTGSIGLATYPEHAEDAVLLLKLADEAMYESKRAGKSRVSVATPSPRTRALRTA